MSVDTTQAKYDELDQISRRFADQAQASGDMHKQVQRAVQSLQKGGWEGQGAAAFFAEMDGQIFPALKRLTAALEQAQSVTVEVKDILQKADEEASQPFKGNGAATENKEGGLWGSIGEWVHGGLDVLGFVPGLGEIADGLNGLIYLAEGRHLEAGISFAAMIPIVGDAGKVGKWGVRIGGEVLEEGGERVVREGAETLIERGTRGEAYEATERYVRSQADRGLNVRGHAAEEAARVSGGPGTIDLDRAATELGGFPGNYMPGYDIASPREIASVKTHWSDAAWTPETGGLTPSSMGAYRRDFDKMLGWGPSGTLDNYADAVTRLRDGGYTVPDAIRNASPTDVARYLRDESVLRIPDDHVGPVRDMLRTRIQQFPGNYHLPDNVSPAQIDDFVNRRIQGIGIGSGDLRTILSTN
jgi:WXG100 family type VII secretion target